MSRRAALGFTLTEVLVASAVMVVALFVVYQLSEISHRSYLAAESRSELSQNGRVVLDRLVREFRQTQDLLTALPDVPDDPLFPPPSEIKFRDGHTPEVITYIRYWHDPASASISREVTAYFFPSDPGTYVPFNAVDEFGQPASSTVLESRTIGEYVEALRLWGPSLLTIELDLHEGTATTTLRTQVVGRNV